MDKMSITLKKKQIDYLKIRCDEVEQQARSNV